jgi:hypothetical protein
MIKGKDGDNKEAVFSKLVTIFKNKISLQRKEGSKFYM